MSYEFKRLGEVNALGEMKEGLNVLAVDGSEVVKIAADEIINESVETAIGNILEAEVLEEASDIANVLVEEDGYLKKVPASVVGGGSCANILTICQDPNNSDNFTANMTFEEFANKLQHGAIAGSMLSIIDGSYGRMMTYNSQWINVDNYPDYITLHFVAGGYEETEMQFNSDNTIVHVELVS